MENKKYYITTPIYYPSGNWHIGHCYTTVTCDAIARFKKMNGFDVFFLTGTDEHGQKIEKRAKEANLEPKEFVDTLVDGLKEIWSMLDISYDKFIRTTDKEHIETVQKIFNKLYEKGDIYKSEYSGWYCTPCESFWTEAQLVDGKCPDCGRAVSLEKEESYFFRLSKYSDRILKLYEENKDFLQPQSRVNEMINNFLKPGLTDLCVSRTSFKWGIPVTFDKNHIVYVWIDALSNYISALGYLSDNDELFKKYWPCDLHLMAKEIVRFHTIIWPALLMALDLPLPKQVFGHGWLLIGGDKLSKSKSGNIKTELVEPKELVERYGSDAIRYFLLREIPFGNDGIYTNESLLKRINSDLANDLGNLVSRTTAMIGQYFDGILQAADKREDVDDELILSAESLLSRVSKNMDALNIPEALSEIFKTIQRANKYIDETTPWLLAKTDDGKARLKTVLYNLSETIRICAIALKPYLTKAPAKILACYKVDDSKIINFESIKVFGILQGGIKVEKCNLLFPRIDVKKELQQIEEMMTKRHLEKSGQISNEKNNISKDEKMQDTVDELEQTSQITIEDFAKVKLKIALVTACEKVEKSDKLLKLSVKIGEEIRTVVSGIAKNFTAEEMVGKKIVMVTNLKPVKLRGILSEGMIICAEDNEGKLALIQPSFNIADGSEIR